MDLEIFPVPRVLTNEGEWVVAGGGRKPSGEGGEGFQWGLEWRHELCKPFLDREGLRLIRFFQHWKYYRAFILSLTTFLEIYLYFIQSEHNFQPYFQLKRQICQIFMEKLSNNPMVIYVKKKWTFLVERINVGGVYLFIIEILDTVTAHMCTLVWVNIYIGWN